MFFDGIRTLDVLMFVYWCYVLVTMVFLFGSIFYFHFWCISSIFVKLPLSLSLSLSTYILVFLIIPVVMHFIYNLLGGMKMLDGWQRIFYLICRVEPWTCMILISLSTLLSLSLCAPSTPYNVCRCFLVCFFEICSYIFTFFVLEPW